MSDQVIVVALTEDELDVIDRALEELIEIAGSITQNVLPDDGIEEWKELSRKAYIIQRKLEPGH